MKRKYLQMLMITALTLCFLCTACGQGEKSARNESNEDADEVLLPEDDPNEGLGGVSIPGVDITSLAGTYLPVDENSEWIYMDIYDDGTWMLYGQNADISGWLEYDEEYEAVYAYDETDNGGCLFYIDDSDGTLYFAAYGYFYYSDMDDVWYEDEEEVPIWNGSLTENSSDYSWNPELYQRNVCEFEGVWYYDGDLSAETYIVIDDSGNWSYYQRAAGVEAAEMDYGTFSYSTDEASVYYADSTMYDSISYRVFELDQDVLIWGDEGAYYLME